MNKLEWKISTQPIEYLEAVATMEQRVNDIIHRDAPELVWLLEHPPLYTAGTSAVESDLLTPSRFPVYKAGRGGQYTYHGPGQRIAYTILDLNKRKRDVRLFVHNLEQWIINTLQHFSINGERRADRIGIWVEREGMREDKIAAIGIRIRHWVTFHGISINVDPQLEHFSGIVPCGVKNHGVTSCKDLGANVTTEDIDGALYKSFEEIFPPAALR